MNGRTFLRAELKYLLSKEQHENLRAFIARTLQTDEYGKSTVQSLYYDTDNYLLIRRSLEKPDFKEKLRLRCYGAPDDDSSVFVELKRKSAGIVYKRRVGTKYGKIKNAIKSNVDFLPSLPGNDKITQEINYFCSEYEKLSPKALLLYDREAYYGENGLRVTFDENTRYRENRLDFTPPLDGIPLFTKGEVIMEIKVSGGIPLWLTGALTKEKIAKTSFSKYGAAYEKIYYENTEMKRYG